MNNPITGSGALGFGFDIFGVYGEESMLRPLMGLGSSSPWTSPAGITYDVPSNASLNPSSGAVGTAYAFTSREQFSSHFAIRAGVKGSYGAFSGEFEAAFAVDTSSETEYLYGLFEENIDSWSLTLIDQSANALLPNVVSDPDFKNLPTQYTIDNQYLFFRFFAKYGTHFVTSVSCGARMSYCVAVSKSYTSDTTTVSAKLSAEYRGTFADAAANAQADFNIADQQWFSSRQATVRTIGGNADLVSSIQPEYDVNHNGPFTSWTQSAEQQPAPIDFQVTPMATLFSGDQAAAVQQAYEAYANNRLYSEARSDGCAILLSGKPLIPSPTSGAVPAGQTISPATPAPMANLTRSPGGFANGWGFNVAVIDRTDLNVALLKAYTATEPSVSVYRMWDEMYEDLQSYAGLTQYVLAFASISWFSISYLYPTPDVVSFLESCGAGTGLDQWRQMNQENLPVNYTLLGVIGIGPNAGIEAFSYDPSTQDNIATATGLLIPTTTGSGEDEFQYDLVPA